ncbi:MAG: hypothetical protein IJQ23_07945 [Clostridia bacterium]|nr:hypothetical protein [Clostridia bacterium]
MKNTSLKYPSIWRRIQPTVIYNVILSAIFFPLYLVFYNLDIVAFELDYFLMYGFESFRLNLLGALFCFFFFLRQVCKDLNLIIFTIRAIKHDEDVILFGGHKRLFDGIEGIGKTLNSTNDAVLLACDKDEKLRFEYYLKKPFEKKLKDDKHYKVLCDSYKFYKDHPDKISHLMANYKIQYDGKESFKFDIDYFKQDKRLAESFVMAITELADELPNSWSKIPKDEKNDTHKVIKMNETLSKSRQWFDLTIVSDEQRMGEVFIGFRATTGLGRSITGRKKCLVPKFLKVIERLLYNCVMWKKERTSKFLSWLYTFVHRITESIGFFEFSYIDRDVLTSKGKTEEQTFVIPCRFLFRYDTRGERDKYPLYDRQPE